MKDAQVTLYNAAELGLGSPDGPFNFERKPTSSIN